MIKGPAYKPHPESLAVGALLTVLMALGQISISITMPSMPALVDALQTTAATVNLTLVVFLAGFGAFQLLYGPLSDRFGRRPVLLAGLALYTLASAACALSLSVETLIMARFAQGVGACAGQVIGRAVVRDVYGRDRAAKAMAYIGAALSISPAVMPVLGGMLQVGYGWPSIFAFTSALGALVYIAAWRLLAETNTETDSRALNVFVLLGNYRTLLKSPVYMSHVAAVVGVFAILMAFTAASPFVFIRGMGMSPHHYGLLSIFNVAGFFIGSVIAGRYASAWGPDRMVALGMGLSLCGGLAMSGLALGGVFTVAAIIGPMMICLAGMGIVLANGMAGALAPFPRIAGSASGLMGFLQMAVAAGLSAFAGRLDNATQTPLALTILTAAIVATALFAGLYAVGRKR